MTFPPTTGPLANKPNMYLCHANTSPGGGVGCYKIRDAEEFKECHKYVPPQRYIDNCIYEACACNQGGDCGCFCSAVAAYAQACANERIAVLWRKEGFCGKPYKCRLSNSTQHLMTGLRIDSRREDLCKSCCLLGDFSREAVSL